MKNNLTTNISIQKVNSLSPGTGITLWTRSGNVIIGETGLGERGLSAESLGKETASKLIREIESGASIDIHAFDQLIPYLALAAKNGISTCLLREISSHAKTNMWLVNQFFNNREIFRVGKEDNLLKITTNKI
jgi:RNA 3'-terminal phosphate cyclase